MKLLVLVALCLVAVAVAAPPPNYQRTSSQDAQIVRYDSDNIGLGKYSYYYEQTDGQRADQQGELRNEGREDEYVAVKGSYSWVGPDGVTYIVRYIADENGYQPEIEQGPGGGAPPGVVASLLG